MTHDNVRQKSESGEINLIKRGPVHCSESPSGLAYLSKSELKTVSSRRTEAKTDRSEIL
jgi:hypothetical protein